MPEAHDTGYLSIGEVLGLLLEDFPDVTISKIRFLESQGLISPERTASGYRKFYDTDVELLRVILTEQRSNYLPLRVIKDRLQNGEIDPTGDHLRTDDAAAGDNDEDDDAREASDVPAASMSSHPSSRKSSQNGAAPDAGLAAMERRDTEPAEPDELASAAPSEPPPAERPAAPSADPGTAPAAAQPAAAAPRPDAVLPGVLLDRAELCAMVGMTDHELGQLESFGIVASRTGTTSGLYTDDAVEIAKPACELLRAGVDARHLRGYRTSAEREVSLYEQLVTPRMRQRNPESRAEALDELRRLDGLGAHLRAAMTRQALRRHFES